MKRNLRYSAWFTILLASISVMGCNSESAAPDKSGAGDTAEEEHGHAHGPDGHSHDHSEEGHGHAPGPHGGTLADWGGGAYHVEFTVDHEQHQATVYILGGDEKTAEPIAAESVLLTIKDPKLQVDLMPDPQEGDPEGKASRFVGKHEGLGTVKEYDGTMSAAVDGTPYAGNFAEEAHGHDHGHSHSSDDALVWEGDSKEHAGMTIKLGHHGAHLHAGEEVEPAVSITKDGKPVDNVEVFNALVTKDGSQVLAKEVATIYEPETAEEPAHYAQGGLKIPADAKDVAIRFRIVPAEGDSVTYDVPIMIE